jgi:hypothetical protein
MFRYVFILLIGIAGHVNAHQFLPTYPTFEYSFIEGVVQTKMQLFNKRKEIEYYELSVYEANWKSLPFATESKIVKIQYLQTKDILVYIKKEDLKRVKYICSESKIQRENNQNTLVSSRICSKIQ